MFIYLNGRRIWTELNAADSGGNEGGGDTVAQGLQNLLTRHNNDAMAVVSVLYHDNYQLRDDNRILKGKVPADGALILTGDDAKAWADYQQLGKPDDLRKTISDKDKLQGELGTLQRDGVLRDVAEAAGYKFTVLKDLDSKAKLSYAVKEIEQDGKKVKAVSVTPEGGQEQALEAYATATWADYLPALRTTAQAAPGTRYPAQNAGGKPPGGKSDPVEDFLQRQEASRAAVKNPLIKE